MADEIRYNTGMLTFQQAARELERRGSYGFRGFGLELPSDLNKLYEIRVNKYGNHMETENSIALTTDDAIRRWKILAPNAKMPMPILLAPQIAVLFVEAIWLDTLWKYSDYYLSGELESDFLTALYLEARHEVPSCGAYPSWEELAKIADEAGIESRIDAWLAGVPLEYILTD